MYNYLDAEKSRKKLRTLTFLIYYAARKVFPVSKIRQDFAVGNSYYFSVQQEFPVLPAQVIQLHDEVRKLIETGLEIKEVDLDYNQATMKLRAKNLFENANWIEDSQGKSQKYISVNGDFLAFDGSLYTDVKDLGEWEIMAYPPGFLLRLPPIGAKKLKVHKEKPSLFRSFFAASEWWQKNNISYVHDVNQVIRNGYFDTFIQVAEAYQSRQIDSIADKIINTAPRPRVVLISGPSSSGKTSFSKRLLVSLQLSGLEPRTLSLDDFYLPRDLVPLNEKGNPDFEVLEALDLEKFNEYLIRLIAGEKVVMPKLDFETHVATPGEEIQLPLNGILIIEGIHGLNPGLTRHLTAASVFKVYVSALTHLNYDPVNRVSTTDLRLLRRIVRDERARGYPADDTLNRWPEVRKSEIRNIFPFQENADIMFNSALPFELNILKNQATRALSVVDDEIFEMEVRRLLNILNSVVGVDEAFAAKHLPPTSIIKEFVGGSVLVD